MKLSESVDYSFYVNDPKYRQYSASIEKALKSFEYTSEWADLISALGKLNKLIQAHSKYSCIPKAVTVSKRLSQCMHPALPFGVHLKALECYKQIFDALGTVNLGRDLCMYSIGLFPLYANATINVRRSLLELYEKYFVALGPLLKPALIGFLNGLLPGFEEGSEFYDRLIELLSQIHVGVGSLYFYSCLWECVYSTPTVRLPALLYVCSQLDRKRSIDDQLHIVGSSIDRMVDALCAAGGDTNVLVQRQLLDFVNAAFPLNSHNLLRSDMIRLVQNCIFVILKRDMSLNRRFYSWLLGPKNDIDYFESITKPLVVESVMKLIEKSHEENTSPESAKELRTKLLRLLLYLLDRPDVGRPLVLQLLSPLLLDLVSKSDKFENVGDAPNENSLKVLGLLLDALKPGFIWEYLNEKIKPLVENCLSTNGEMSTTSSRLTGYLDVVDLLLGNKDLLSHSDNNGQYISDFLIQLLEHFRCARLHSSSYDVGQLSLAKRYLETVSRLLHAVQRISTPVDLSALIEQLENENGKSSDEDEEKKSDHIFDSQICFETCRRSAASIISSVVGLFTDKTAVDGSVQLLRTLVILLKELADLPIYSILEFPKTPEQPSATWVKDLCRLCFTQDFVAQRQAVDLLLHIYALWKSIVEQRRLAVASFRKQPVIEKPTALSIVLKPMLPENYSVPTSFFKELANSLWERMGPNEGEYYDEACRLFLLLHSVEWSPGKDGYGDSVCVDLALEKMTTGDQVSQAEGSRRFCVIWSLGRRYLGNLALPGYPVRPLIRPALLLLNNLQSDTVVGQLAQYWFDDCLDRGDLPTILHAFCTALAQPSMARLSVQSVKISPIMTPETKEDESSVIAYRIDSYSKGALYHRLNAQAKNLPDVTTFEPPPESIIEGLINEIVDTVASEFQDEDISEDIGSTNTYDTTMAGVVDDFESEVPDDQGRSAASSACSASTAMASSSPTTNMTNTFDEAPTNLQLTTSIRSQHAHILLYRHRFDLRCPTQAFRLLARMITYAPRRFVEILLSTGPPICETSGELSYLLACHQKSLAGFEFTDGDDVEKNVGCRSPTSMCMYFESLFTLSLYFIRSNFVDDPLQKITFKDLQYNWYLKGAAVNFLASTVRVIGDICDDGGRSVSAYVADVLSRCKLQKCILHCLMSHVGNDEDIGSDIRNLFADAIIKFNSNFPNSNYILLSYESDLLKLLEAIVHVEYRIRNAKADFSASGIILDKLSVNAQVSPAHAARQATPMASQKLFLFVLLNALKHAPYVSHDAWLRFIVRCLPFMEKSLPTVLLHACEQLCRNLEYASQLYVGRKEAISDGLTPMPVNYVSNVLETMTILCHFALLDSTAGCIPSSTQLGGAITLDLGFGNGGNVGAKAAAGEVFGNLARVFAFGDVTMAQAPSTSSKENNERKVGVFVQAARQELLAALPHMLSTLCGLWAAIKSNNEPLIPVGPPQRVRRLILEFLSPVAVNQTRHFLSALSLVWLTRSSDKRSDNKVFTDSQMELVDLLLCIKMLPFEKLVAGVVQTLKQPIRPKNTDEKDSFPLEISLLEMVTGIQEAVAASVVKSSWTALHNLIVDGLSFITLPSSRFLLFKLFSAYVLRVQTIDDKTNRKEAQDACQKLVESVNDIVAWHLEQPTWLKRSLVVKQDTEGMLESAWLMAKTFQSVCLGFDEKQDPSGAINGLNNTKHTALWSAKALDVFAEHLASLLDLVYKNEEKDRMIPVLTSVWTNILPYLKTRTYACRRHFAFASKFLARLSQYSQTRTVWRKPTIDLVVEPNFFSCGDIATLKQWSIIVDNLMTQDKTTFKEFLAKTAISQSAGIFTSRDQEYESRGAALKRLAFVVLSSDVDQYQPYFADIQERLTENLRLYQVPHVCADVFLCFRTLLIRLSPHHLLPMWPTMITETMQVLLLIEQELKGSNGVIDDYKCARDDQWLLLYVAGVKFLDALCKLPPSKLPQFQMYQWVFTTPILNEDVSLITDNYIPQIERIRRLMDIKYGQLESDVNGSCSLASLKHANSLKDLHTFFITFCDTERLHRQALVDPNEAHKEIEDVLYKDLLAAML